MNIRDDLQEARNLLNKLDNVHIPYGGIARNDFCRFIRLVLNLYGTNEMYKDEESEKAKSISAGGIEPDGKVVYMVVQTPVPTLQIGDLVRMVETPSRKENVFVRIHDFSLHEVDNYNDYVMVVRYEMPGGYR